MQDFLNCAEEIGFVDMEADGEERLLFNGNLFHRHNVAKPILSAEHRTKNLLTARQTDLVERAQRIWSFNA
ncbi:MAG: hypothetical protein EOQ98_06675 [Mesorhizobium sp.]|uniref:hypothetical protein n=1 Tax=Mesorhizobium sp. TaxID=1871066 RepID=UPI000FE52505|nr:hypothetical protein [Mesorhizobium sp.]RWP01368.1 MAG: hypothetical protein EOQ98_06675 [Mesorhizobium sp.]TIM51655.1 MAG: hypothetical protein E5Y69_04465 [Mesorhizobium sp.]